jgi:hypothetical protein
MEVMDKKKSIPMIRVRILFRKGSAIVIERQIEDTPVRVCVTEDLLQPIGDSDEANISEDQFDMGIPYGIPFDLKFHQFVITPEKLSLVFHQSNLWTVDDLVKNPKAVQGAILAACRDIFLDINTLIRETKE